MRAICFYEFGGPEVLRIEERDLPEPTDGEVVIKTFASPVNPTDIMMRDGRQAKLMEGLRPPYIPGVEFSGHVHGQGPGISHLQAGQLVIGLVNARRPAGGCHAEYICVPATSVASIPFEVDPVAIATIPMNGLTAKIAVDMLELAPGSTVLVTGGAGAVGGYAIALASNAGFTVVADSAPSDVPLLEKFGTSHIVPRGDGMVRAVRELYPAGVDGVIDAAVIPKLAAEAVRDGGIALSLRSAHPITDPRLQARFVNVFAQQNNSAALSWLGEAVAARKLTPRVARKLPMSEAVEANRLVQNGGLRGRVVLTFES